MKTLKPRIKPVNKRLLSPVVAERDRSRSARLRILKRDGYLCQSCLPAIVRAAVVDHIVPLHLGGHDNDSNKQSLCLPCHDIKSAVEEQARHR